MPQLHLYVPQPIAETIQRRAKAAGKSVSSYLAQLVEREIQEGWPAGFFEEVVGGWRGDPLQRPPQGEYETREKL